MNFNSADAVSAQQTHLLDELQNLLKKQVELTQQGNITAVESLSEQANSLVEKIAQTGILELAEFKNQREHLAKLYDSLSLAITAQKTETAEKLNRVCKGRRTLHVYHRGI